MATLQELSIHQVNESLREAADRQVPATATIQREGNWHNLHARFVAVDDQHFVISLAGDESKTDIEFAPADRIGLSFKLKHHKHIFTATVASVEALDNAQGGQTKALRICCPTRMQRLQRRAYLRVNVPINRIVRASFWLGGCQAEPAGTSADQPVWSGRVTNLSAGGFQLLASADPGEAVETGDTVGIRMVFGAGLAAVYADAQFRHAETNGEQILLGFQFLGLAHSATGRKALETISAKVAEFQRLETVQGRRVS